MLHFVLALISAYLHSSGNHTESQCLWSWFAPSARMLVQLLPLSALYWLSNGHASEKIIKEKQLRKVDKPIRQSALRDFIFRVIVICALLFPMSMLCILDSMIHFFQVFLVWPDEQETVFPCLFLLLPQQQLMIVLFRVMFCFCLILMDPVLLRA